MDLMSLLRYLFDHNQQVIGGLMVIILATAALLAMRMVAQEKSAGPAGASRSGASDLDLGAIESAFKRVLAAQGGVAVTTAGATTASSASSSADGGRSSAELSERDTKIQDLAREIDRLTSELNSRSDGSGFGGTAPTAASAGGADSGQLETLQAKISELEGKLTEYEIIEDDIADLSRYKEENSELRGELEALKARVGHAAAEVAAPSAAPPVAEAEEAEPNPFASLEEELATITGGGAATGVTASPKSDAAPAPFGVPESAPTQPVAADEVAVEIESVEPTAALAAKSERDEATLKDFAASVEVQKGPEKVAPSSDLNFAVAAAALADGSSILDDSVDTEKMFEEVSTLAQSNETADDVLEGTLDTDKLMEELSSLGGTPPAATAAPAAPAQPTSAPTPNGAPDPIEEAKFEDDLLAEFKDSNDGGQG